MFCPVSVCDCGLSLCLSVCALSVHVYVCVVSVLCFDGMFLCVFLSSFVCVCVCVCVCVFLSSLMCLSVML